MAEQTTDPPVLGVGMVGYAFMGAAHSQAWRTVHHAFDVPLTPRMAVLCGRAGKVGKRISTLALEVEVRFASAEARNAFAEELGREVAGLAAKYHDENASGGRRFRFFGGVYPVITKEEPLGRESVQIQ